MLSAYHRVTKLLWATTITTYLLILLGIYTAAVGAGLTCGARWPLCDGAVFGLFPANWPSFVEWFHRLIALIAGFMIIGSGYALFRRSTDGKAKIVMIGVIVLLPVQIWLGAQTVLRYETAVLILHFSSALIIFSGLVYTSVRITELNFHSLDRVRTGTALVGVLLPALVLVSPSVITVHSARFQVAYNGIGLAIFALLLAIFMGIASSRPHHEMSRKAMAMVALIGFVLTIVLLQLVVGRVTSVFGISTYTQLSDLLVLPGTALAFLGVVLVIFLTYRIQETVGPSRVAAK